jgi:hypothetical protein
LTRGSQPCWRKAAPGCACFAAASRRRRHGRLPLHLAADRYVAVVEVVQLLAEMRPESLGVKDCTTRPSAGTAARPCTCRGASGSRTRRAPPRGDERRTSSGAPGGPVARFDCTGRLPLHVAAQCRALEGVGFLVGVSFHALQERTSDGPLPGQVAAARYDAKLDVFYFLARARPEALGRSAVPKKAP